MPALRRYNGFISHAWRYNEEYYRLETMLKTAINFDFYNYSVPEHNPLIPRTLKALGLALEKQMRLAQFVLVISGMYVAYSDWIDFEIAYAVRTGKPIIGINPRGSLVTPRAVSRNAKIMVGWNTTSIVSAIRTYALQPVR